MPRAPRPAPPKPEVAKQSLRPVAQREPAQAQRAEAGGEGEEGGEGSEEKTAEAPSEAVAVAATAPEIGAGSEPVLVDRPAFASPPSPPVYPRLARQRRQQGTVVIEVQLGRAGEQVARQLLQSSGVDSLDRAALAAVKSWQFLPFRENDRPRQSRVRLPIRFAL